MSRNPALGIPVFISLVVFIGFFEPGFSHGAGNNKVRLLQFPADYSVGTLGLLEEIPGATAKGKVLPIGEARGLIRVPKDKFVKFQPGVRFFQHPECLLKLPPDGIDYIQLRYTAMADGDEKISDRLIPYVHHLSGLKGIDMDQSETTDVGLAKLGTMPELRALALSETLVTGKCLPQLVGCQKLESMRFGKAAIDNESLRYLKEFPNLAIVDLARTNLSLRGLEHVSRCSKVRTLDLNDNPKIDDRAIPLISKLSNLRNLQIKGTKISLAGVIQLSKIGLTKISLPHSFNDYSRAEQAEIRKAFPANKFKGHSTRVDSYTRTMFGPLSR